MNTNRAASLLYVNDSVNVVADALPEKNSDTIAPPVIWLPR